MHYCGECCKTDNNLVVGAEIFFGFIIFVEIRQQFLLHI